MTRRREQKGDETAKPVESMRLLVESKRLSVNSARLLVECARWLVESVRLLFEVARWLVESVRLLFESARWLVESVRLLFESARWLVESTRLLFESARWLVESTRLLFESARWLVESTRLLFESARWLVESKRLLFESARWLVESKRLLFESARLTAKPALLQHVQVAFRMSFSWTHILKPNLITLGTTLPSTLASIAHVNAHAYTGVIGSGSMTQVDFVVLRNKLPYVRYRYYKHLTFISSYCESNCVIKVVLIEIRTMIARRREI